MEVFKITAEMDVKDGLVVAARKVGTVRTQQHLKTTDGERVVVSNFMKPQGMWPRVTSFCMPSDVERAKKMAEKVILNLYRERREELDRIEEALSKVSTAKGPKVFKLSPEEAAFIGAHSTVLYEDVDDPFGQFFFNPNWYERIGENEFKVHPLGSLPERLKRKIRHWRDFSEAHPELKLDE